MTQAAGPLLSPERTAAFQAETDRILARITEAMRRRRADPEGAHAVAYTQGTADGIRAGLREAVLSIVTLLAIRSEARETRERRLEARIAALEAAAPRRRAGRAVARAGR